MQGPARIIGDEIICANPCKVEWVRAVALVGATTKPGQIKVIAEELFDGINTPGRADLAIYSVAPEHVLLYSELPKASADSLNASEADDKTTNSQLRRRLDGALKALNELKLKEVERQQEHFEGPGQ